MQLIIVESAAKAKKIQGFLKGQPYIVKASFGHLRDLPSSELGVDCEKDFEPKYVLTATKSRVISELRKASSDVKKSVIIATDDDREGEAIGFHLCVILGLPLKETPRIIFHEVTPSAIKRALESPKRINMNLVNSQQGRRILDRLVGYLVSPCVYRTIGPNSSAGRVQSVVLDICVKRETEIAEFWGAIPPATWSTTALFAEFGGSLAKGPSLDDALDAAALEFMERCRAHPVDSWRVADIKEEMQERKPAPPYTTSTLQQDVCPKLRIGNKRLMSIAQKLYESGHITYHRTDSKALSGEFIGKAGDYVKEKWGAPYHQVRGFKKGSPGSKKKAGGPQEAHEAIRPTKLKTSEELEGLDAISARVYDFIFRRALATQMANAQVAHQRVMTSPEPFEVHNHKLIFPGFLVLFPDNELLKGRDTFVKLESGATLNLTELGAHQVLKEPPQRYHDGSMVKKLESLGVGRPSTYASIIDTNLVRQYLEAKTHPGREQERVEFSWPIAKKSPVRRVKKQTLGADKAALTPTEKGVAVCQYLREKFPLIVKYDFTAEVEKDLDRVEKGKKLYQDVVRQYFDLLKPIIEAERAKPAASAKAKSRYAEKKSLRTLATGVEIRKNGYGLYAYHPGTKTIYNIPKSAKTRVQVVNEKNLDKFTDEQITEVLIKTDWKPPKKKKGKGSP